MKLTKEEFCKYLDWGPLDPDLSEKQVLDFCSTAREYNFAAFYAHPCRLNITAKELAGTDIEIGTGISFPFGTASTKVKMFEAENALKMGATALDMVINIGALKDGNHQLVLQEIKELVNLAAGSAVTKIIPENGLLSKQELVTVCELISEGGADFIKSSTGRLSRGILLDEIKLMRQTVSSRVGVKASGFGGYLPGVIALACIRAGADRFGTAFGPDVVADFDFLDEI